eukprot:3563908-Amphidinium_carterae.1
MAFIIGERKAMNITRNGCQTSRVLVKLDAETGSRRARLRSFDLVRPPCHSMHSVAGCTWDHSCTLGCKIRFCEGAACKPCH